MHYRLLIKKKAEKKLISLSSVLRVRIVEKIQRLANNPDDPQLDIKKLVGEDHYRLRVGDWRIIFGRDDYIRIISIDAVKPRGDAYK